MIQTYNVFLSEVSPHLDVEGNKGVGMQWEQQGFDQQWLMFSVKRCNYPGRSRVSRLVTS